MVKYGYLPAVMEHLPPAGAIQIKVYSPMKQQINFFVSPLAAGSFTNIQVQTKTGLDLWEPWIDQSPHRSVTRNLHKHADGSSLCFEEYHQTHQLTFRWEWTMCDTYGFVRICTLKNAER